MPDPAGDGLLRATPESRGVSSRDLGRFLDTVQALGIELHSVMLYRRGAVIAEGWWAPYRADRPHMQHSLAKSFTATAVGLALAEGLLHLDAPVASFFPKEMPASRTDHLGAMTLRHLLTMRTGHAVGISGGVWRQVQTSWIRAFFAAAVPEPPGTRFVYNSAASYMLSAVVQKVSGQTLHEFLRPRLLETLGSTGLAWESGPDGVNPGGNGMSCRTADLLRLGILYLQNGRWEGQQVLTADWVRAATRPWVADATPDGRPEMEIHLPTPAEADRSPGHRGYGYHWWTGPEGAYYASGLFGQYVVVLPEVEAVFACTAALLPQDQRLLDLIWRDLRPMLGNGSMQPDTAEADYLSTRMRGLKLPLRKAGAPSSTTTGRVSGRVYDMAPNQDGVRSVSLLFRPGICVFHLEDEDGFHRIEVGLGSWVEGTTSMPGGSLHHHYQTRQLCVAARGGWDDEQTFRMDWVFPETAFRDEVICRFTDDGLTIDRSVNVNTGPRALPQFVGRCAA